MKPNKLIMGLLKITMVFVGVLLINISVAQTSNPTGVKVDDVASEYGNVIVPDGFTPPTTPSVGFYNDQTNLPKAMLEEGSTEEKNSPQDNAPEDPYPSYWDVNVLTLTATDGSETIIKVQSWEDEIPAFVDTGDPVKDKANFVQVLDQWILNHPPK